MESASLLTLLDEFDTDPAALMIVSASVSVELMAPTTTDFE